MNGGTEGLREPYSFGSVLVLTVFFRDNAQSTVKR